MNNILKSLFFLGFIMFLFSCHRKIQVAKAAPTETIVHKKDSCKLNFKYNNLVFNTLSAKGKLSYQDQNNSQSANFHLRIKRDSIIWISVHLMGIEGARFIITKDSILGINKLQKDVYLYSIKHFSKLFKIDLSYKSFENILVGNMPINARCSDTLMFKGNYEILKRDSTTNNIEAYINGQNLRLEKFLVVQKPLSNSLTVDYSEFQALFNILFGYKLNASIKYLTEDNRVVYNSIYMEYNKVEIDEKELKFPFSIPNRYNK